MREEPKIFIWRGERKGGVAKTTLAIAEGFRKYHGLDPTLGVFEREEIGFDQIEVKRVFPKRLSGYNAVWGTFYLNKKGVLHGFDITYSQGGFFLKTKRNFYVCYEIGDLDKQLVSMPLFSSLTAFPVVKVHIYMMKRADLVVGISKECRAFFQKYGIRNYEICPTSFVDTSRFKPKKDSEPSGKFRILFVGRVSDPRKNFLSLANVCSKLEDKVDLYAVGPAERKLGKFGNLHLLGEITEEELVRWYNACDLFVLPSFWEGPLPLVILEALACKKPILASLGAIGEELKPFVVAFNPFSSRDLESKILWVMENYKEAKKLAERGCRFVRRNYEKEVVMKKMTDLILEKYEEWKG
jgi:glycosyltransferase involved in cell wall biosynthesis